MAIFISPDAAADYMLAGRAVFTVKSLATGEHITYRIARPENRDVWFVSVLMDKFHGGQAFEYLGMLSGSPLEFRLTRKSPFPVDNQLVKVFKWCFGNIVLLRRFPKQLEVRHEGSCGKCGRPLTRPDSIDLGIGPECRKRLCEAA